MKETKRRIKDLPPGTWLRGVKFRHPVDGAICYWWSQWGYEDGEAGVWYKTDLADSHVYPIFLDSLAKGGEFELVEP